MVYNDKNKTLTFSITEGATEKIEQLDKIHQDMINNTSNKNVVEVPETEEETTDEEVEELKKEFQLDSEAMYRDKALIKALRGLKDIMASEDEDEEE